MMKFYLSNRFGIGLVILLVLIVAISMLIGFVIDVEGFSGNLLAEIAGNGIAILAGLLLIDRLLEYRRERQWVKVRNLTLQAIGAHLCDIASYVYIYFHVREYGSMQVILQGRDSPRSVAMRGFESLLKHLRAGPRGDIGDRSISDVAVEFYEAVAWDLDQIQTVLTPRVVQSSGDQNLIDALVEFDDTRRKLHNAIIGHKLIKHENVFPHVVSLIECSSQVYETLCASWNGNGGPNAPNRVGV